MLSLRSFDGFWCIPSGLWEVANAGLPFIKVYGHERNSLGLTQPLKRTYWDLESTYGMMPYLLGSTRL